MNFLFFGFILLLTLPAEASAAEATTLQILIREAPPTLMALAALVAAVKGLRQSKANGVQAATAEKAATEKAKQLSKKADLIHEVAEDTRTMANGNLAGVTAELKALRVKYAELQKLIAGEGSDTVLSELVRVAANVHRIANAVTPLLGQDLQLIPRPQGSPSSDPSGKAGIKP